jgi:hypothetical protein
MKNKFPTNIFIPRLEHRGDKKREARKSPTRAFRARKG